MTAMPEAAIARELAMCFTTIALVTDHDAGVHGGEAVTHEEVLRVFARNVEGLKEVLKSRARRHAGDRVRRERHLSVPSRARRDHAARAIAGLSR